MNGILRLRRRLLLVFAILAGGGYGYAQAPDSLYASFAQARDTDRANAALKLAEWYCGQSQTPDSIRRYAQIALRIAERKQFPMGQARAWMFLGLADMFQYRGESGVRALEQARRIAVEHRLETLEISILINLGLAWRGDQKWQAALDALNTARERADKLGEPSLEAQAVDNIGNVYKAMGLTLPALRYYMLGRTMHEAAGDSGGMARQDANIAGIYYGQSRYAEALKRLHQSLRYFERAGNVMNQAITWYNLGPIYNEDNRPAEALRAYQRAEELYRALGVLPGQATALIGMGEVMGRQGDMRGGMKRIRQARAIFRSLKNPVGEAEAAASLADAYRKLQRPDSARILAEEAAAIAAAHSLPEFRRQAAAVLHELYAESGDYGRAYAELLILQTIKDSLTKTENTTEFDRLEAQFAYERAQNKARRRAMALARLREEAASRRNRLSYSGVTLFLAAGLGALAMLRKRRANDRTLRVGAFIVFLILFEFILVLSDPLVDAIVKDNPLVKLCANIAIAVALAPLHHLAVRRIGRVRRPEDAPPVETA